MRDTYGYNRRDDYEHIIFWNGCSIKNRIYDSTDFIYENNSA